MNRINIPLRQRVVRTILLLVSVLFFSIIYFFSEIKTMNNEVKIYKEKANDWKKKVVNIKTKIAEIEKKIEYKENRVNITFSKEEINELANVYSSICKYIYQKYNVNCILQGIEKGKNYINVIKIYINVKTDNYKDVIVIANVLSYLTNKFIALKTNIKIKEIKIVNNNEILIELYKKD